jgi:hypothetical protein
MVSRVVDASGKVLAENVTVELRPGMTIKSPADGKNYRIDEGEPHAEFLSSGIPGHSKWVGTVKATPVEATDNASVKSQPARERGGRPEVRG